MKYMIMTFGDESAWDTLGLGGSQATWSEEEVAEHFRAMGAFYADLAASGEMVTGFGLADPSHTVTVEIRDGRPVASDGPYAEAASIWSPSESVSRPRRCWPASASLMSPPMTGRWSSRASSPRSSRRGSSCAR